MSLREGSNEQSCFNQLTSNVLTSFVEQFCTPSSLRCSFIMLTHTLRTCSRFFEVSIIHAFIFSALTTFLKPLLTFFSFFFCGLSEFVLLFVVLLFLLACFGRKTYICMNVIFLRVCFYAFRLSSEKGAKCKCARRASAKNQPELNSIPSPIIIYIPLMILHSTHYLAESFS